MRVLQDNVPTICIPLTKPSCGPGVQLPEFRCLRESTHMIIGGLRHYPVTGSSLKMVSKQASVLLPNKEPSISGSTDPDFMEAQSSLFNMQNPEARARSIRYIGKSVRDCGFAKPDGQHQKAACTSRPRTPAQRSLLQQQPGRK